MAPCQSSQTSRHEPGQDAETLCQDQLNRAQEYGSAGVLGRRRLVSMEKRRVTLVLLGFSLLLFSSSNRPHPARKFVPIQEIKDFVFFQEIFLKQSIYRLRYEALYLSPPRPSMKRCWES